MRRRRKHRRRTDLPAAVVLASASPERCRLLRTLVPVFDVVEPDVDEDLIRGAQPATVCLRRARAKAAEVWRRRPASLVIAADTVVACGGSLMGKPKDVAEARRMLRLLTSKPHSVVSALCVMTPCGRRRLRVVSARVRMRPFSDDQIEACVQADGALDRAGVYALQPDDPNVLRLDGSASCVMGLPLEALEEILDSLYGFLPQRTPRARSR